MKQLRYILVMAALFAVCASNAQKPKIDIWNPPAVEGISELKIGEVVPDFKMKLFNSTKKEVKVSDYKDQLLILDFGNTGCVGCIKALPGMEKLRKQFAGRLEVFWVTPEYMEDVAAFWNRKTNKYTAGNTMPVVVEDRIARSYFKHNSWPHEAWIYKGKVIAITGPDFVDANNVQKVLDGEQINWPVKNDFYVFDATKQPLFKVDPNQVDTGSSFIKYVTIGGYKEGVSSSGFGSSGIVRDAKKNTIRTYALNTPIFNAYMGFWMNVIGFGAANKLTKPGELPIPQNPNEAIWKVTDRLKYQFDEKNGYEQQYAKDYAISYESLRKDEGQTDAEVYQAAINDLNKLLGLNARWEKRKEKVLVLVRTGQTGRLKSKTKIQSTYEDKRNGIDRHLNVNGSLHQFRDYRLSNLVSLLNKQEGVPYIFDETGYKNGVDMDLNFSSWTDLAGIRKALQAYGLDLKAEERLVDKFVFTEINGGKVLDRKMMREAKVKLAAQKDMPNPAATDNTSFLNANKKKPGVVTLPSGLQYKVIKTGKGNKPVTTDKVIVNYQGTLVNGKIFDSSYQIGKATVFGVSDVIKGWTEALKLMPVGSKWMIYVPAELAYGTSTNSGRIPPSSTLVFEIELVGILK